MSSTGSYWMREEIFPIAHKKVKAEKRFINLHELPKHQHWEWTDDFKMAPALKDDTKLNYI